MTVSHTACLVRQDVDGERTVISCESFYVLLDGFLGIASFPCTVSQLLMSGVTEGRD